MDLPVIKSDSLLFKIAKKGNSDLSWNRTTDTCQLFWALIWGVLSYLAIGFCIFLGSAVFLGLPVLSLYLFALSNLTFIQYLNLDGNGPMQIGKAIMIVECLVILFFGMMVLYTWVKEWNENRPKNRAYRAPKPPGPIKLIYHSWKDKFCIDFQIERPAYRHDSDEY